MKAFKLALIFVIISSFAYSQNKYSETITKEEIIKQLYFLASDSLEGRDTGKEGQKIAAVFISKQFKEIGLKPINTIADSMYYQKFKYNNINETENVIGILEGKSEDWIVITAHYDHIGKKGNKIYNGADDNASGTTALIQIAKALMKAKQSGEVLNKNIMFIAFSGEELGLLGAKHFVKSKFAENRNIILNINMDMIGKSIRYGIIETFRESDNVNFKEDTTLKEDYVYLLKKGSKTRTYAKYSRKSGKKYNFYVDKRPGLLLRIGYRGSSDHKPFLDRDIPIMVYFTGLHPEYHTSRDTADKIDYDNLTVITKIIFETVFKIATKQE